MKTETRSPSLRVKTRRLIRSWKPAVYRFFVGFTCFAMVMQQSLLLAQNPTGGIVTNGAATITQGGNLTTIQQQSSRAIVNWQNFSLGSGNTVNFNLPNSSAAILNRVTGGNPSAIYGAMNSNGNVYLLNQNGILIGNGASINVGGFTATTLDISNNNFMRGGELHFSGNSTASVINQGNIIANSGNVFLMGAHVENRGNITAPVGTVGLAAGQDVRLVDSKYPSMVVKPNANSLGGTGVYNSGTINSAAATLAAANGNVYALAINNEGTIRATGAEITSDGEVYLRANGGRIVTSGSLIAKSGTNGENGGKINIDAGEDGFANIQGQVDASGQNGGQVNVNAGRTMLQGEINTAGANKGGTVEIASNSLDQMGKIDASSMNGAGGTVSINIDGDYIATTAGDIDVSGTTGGQISIFAGNKLITSGELLAKATNGTGGQIDLSGNGRTALLSAIIDASGTNAGGRIRIGGELKGGRDSVDEFTNSLETIITTGSDILAQGTGNNAIGGEVIVWSDGNTDFYGNINVSGNGIDRGGFIELSAAETLVYDQASQLITGQGGQLLLDPKNGIITDTPPAGFSVVKLVLDKTVLERVVPGGDPILFDSDLFGSSVAFNDAGDLLAVGVRQDDTGGTDRGSVYVFSLDPLDPASGVLLETRISDGLNSKVQLSNNDLFGFSVAFNDLGNVLAVGAPESDLTGTDRGAVYLFSVDPTDIANNTNLQQTITDTSAGFVLANGDRFGSSVSLNGLNDILAVGAPRDATGGAESGAVYLLTLDPTDLTIPAILGQKIDNNTPGLTLQPGGRFGISASLNSVGDILAVGAHTDDTGGVDRGSAYLLSVDTTDLTAPVLFGQKISSNTAGLTLADSDIFGIAVSLNANGDILAVGASEDDTGGTNRGAVYLITVDPTDLAAAITVQQKIDSNTTGLTLADDDRFGRAVALNGFGDLLAVGAVGDDGNLGTDRGAAYIFSLDPFDLTQEALLEFKIADGTNLLRLGAFSSFGTGVELNSFGDLLAVGANGTTGAVDRVFLFNIDPTDAGSTAILGQVIQDGTDGITVAGGDGFGESVALNDNGDLLAIGAPGDNSGAVYLFTIDPIAPEIPAIFEQKIENGTGGLTLPGGAQFGRGVALNGDNSVLAVGAVGDDAAYLFSLDSFTPSTPAVFEQRIGAGTAGITVGFFGDFGADVALNSTGNLLAVSNPGWEPGGADSLFDQGGVFLLSIDPNNLSNAPTLEQIVEDGSGTLTLDADARFGRGIALSDSGNILAVGAETPVPGNGNGGVFLFNLNTADFSQTASLEQTIFDQTAIDRLELSDASFGQSVALDGLGNILAVGRPGDANSALGAGSAYLFELNATTLSTPAVVRQIVANQFITRSGNNFGSAVSFNATGEILAVGAAGEGAGAAYVFSLGGGRVNNVALQQRITSNTFGVDYDAFVGNEGFGSGIALNDDGSILAVGAKDRNNGAVYLFSLNPLDLSEPFVFEQKIADGTDGLVIPTSAEFGDGLGLNGTGNLLAVGAPFFISGDNSVYIFSLDVTDLTVEAQLEQTINAATLVGSDITPGDDFGRGVAFNSQGNLLAVGAPDDTTNGRLGSVYILSLDPLNPATPAVIEQKIEDGTNGINFSFFESFGAGVDLSGSGDQLIVGAPNFGSPGTVYRFTLDPLNPSIPVVLSQTIADGSLNGQIDSVAGFGRDVALTNDGNTVAIGSPSDTSTINTGAVWLIQPLIANGDPGDRFIDFQDDTTFITPAQLTNLLNAGTDVNLEFNNDLRVASNVIVSGANPGNLDIEVGRNFSVDPNIGLFTNGGDLTVTLNDADAIAASRDPGLATFTLGAGAAVATTNNTFLFGPGGNLTININDLDGIQSGIVQLLDSSTLFSGPGDLTITAGNGGTGVPAVSINDAVLGTIGPGNLSVTSLSGDITTGPPLGNAAQIVVGGTATFTTPATDNVLLAGSRNNFAGTVNVPQANNVFIEDSDNLSLFYGPSGLRLGTINANSLTAIATGPLTDVGIANIIGDANFTGSTILLDQLNVAGSISLTSTGESTIVNAVTTDLGTSIVGGDLDVTATTGDITDTGTTTVAGMAHFTTNGNIALDDLFVTGSIGFDAGGNVRIRNLLDTDIKTSVAGGEVVISADTNNLTDSGTITVQGPFAGFIGNNITIDQLNLVNGEIGIFSTNNTTLVNTGDVNFTGRAPGSFVGGDLVAQSINGDITDNGPLVVNGMAHFTAANIFLDQITISGSIGLNSTANSTIVNSIATDLKASTIQGNLDVTATTGDVTDSDDVVVAGMAHFTGENILLDQIHIAGPVGVNTPGNATLTNSSNLNLKTSTVGGDLNATATTGALTDSGTVTVAGMAHFSGDLIFLNQLAIAGSIGLNSTGNSIIFNATDIDLKTSNVGGLLFARALTGDITDSGIVTVAGDASFSADNINLNQLNVTGGINLTSTGNSTVVNDNTLRLLNANVGGILDLTSTNEDLVSGNVTANTIRFTAGRDILVLGNILSNGAGGVNFLANRSIIVDSDAAGQNVSVAALNSNVNLKALGDIRILSSATNPTFVGSRNGNTNVMAGGNVLVESRGFQSVIGFDGGPGATGDITVMGEDVTVRSIGGTAQIGHRAPPGAPLSGDISVLGRGNIILSGNAGMRARIGHFNAGGPIASNVVVAVDFDPADTTDNGGRFIVDGKSTIGDTGNVRLFAPRQLGNRFEDGAIVGGFTVDSTLLPGTEVARTFNFSLEGLITPREQYLITFDPNAQPFTPPFTFFYEQQIISPVILSLISSQQNDIYDRFRIPEIRRNTIRVYPVGDLELGYPLARPADEITGASSADYFGSGGGFLIDNSSAFR